MRFTMHGLACDRCREPMRQPGSTRLELNTDARKIRTAAKKAGWRRITRDSRSGRAGKDICPDCAQKGS